MPLQQKIDGNPLAPNLNNAPRVTVKVGNVDFNVSPSKYIDPGEEQQLWTDFKIRNKFEKDHHRYMMGITSPNGFEGASVAFVQLASPTLLWIADWTACRYNIQPDIPDPTPADTNWVLLDEHYEPTMLTVGADQITPLYRISGTYVYGHKNPASVTVSNINYARPPWLENSFVRNVPTSVLKQNLVNNTQQGQGGGKIGQ